MTQISKVKRPDIDIEEDIFDMLAHYPPLQADRHHLRIDVRDGEVILSGHVKSPISQRYLVDKVAEVRGVRGVESSRLYSEEAIRLESGQRIPTGVIANASYGTVVLTGTLPPDKTVDQVVGDVAVIPGVEQVVTKF